MRIKSVNPLRINIIHTVNNIIPNIALSSSFLRRIVGFSRCDRNIAGNRNEISIIENNEICLYINPSVKQSNTNYLMIFQITVNNP